MITVAELIAVLQTMPQDLPVEMGMNQEYQCAVSAEDISVEQYDSHNEGRAYVMIGN